MHCTSPPTRAMLGPGAGRGGAGLGPWTEVGILYREEMIHPKGVLRQGVGRG